MRAFLTLGELTKLDAIRYATERTEREGRRFVARTDGRRFFVVPLYEAGKEGQDFDAEYAKIGPLLEDADREPFRFSVGDVVSVFWEGSWRTGRVSTIGFTSPFLDCLMIENLLHWFPFCLCRKEGE